MSSPTPAVAPVAVLVLAWDETTPAVRALVEAAEVATQLVDSVTVVVPAGPGAGEELTQEEFLPLPTLPELPASKPLGATAEQTAAENEAEAVFQEVLANPEKLFTTASALSQPVLASVASTSLPKAAAAPFPTPLVTTNAASTLPTPAWEVVRVLRLSSFSLPALAERAGRPLPAPIWTGTGTVPAAPYVGSAEADNKLIEQVYLGQYLNNQATSSEVAATALPAATTPLLLPTGKDSSATFLPAVASTDALPPSYPQAESLSLGADLEEPEFSLVETDELTDETDSLYSEAGELLTTAFIPEQAGWLDALAALRQPATELAAAPALASQPAVGVSDDAKPAIPMQPALQPAAGSFEAPNLNFQVIQYARFAVPIVLAEQPFAVLYAPAWPTWLAAQELRQRTGQPLVLHVTTLAATAGESVEKATGWVAELQRQALRRADLILTETPALAIRLRQDLNLPAATVLVVPAADAAAIAQALHTVHVRPVAALG